MINHKDRLMSKKFGNNSIVNTVLSQSKIIVYHESWPSKTQVQPESRSRAELLAPVCKIQTSTNHAGLCFSTVSLFGRVFFCLHAFSCFGCFLKLRTQQLCVIDHDFIIITKLKTNKLSTKKVENGILQSRAANKYLT